jgi:hypothetical protein
MPVNLPRLVHLLESLDEIKLVRPYTESFTDVITYNTQHEKYLLQNGYDIDPFDSGRLEPGTLFMRFYLIGLEFNNCKSKKKKNGIGWHLLTK